MPRQWVEASGEDEVDRTRRHIWVATHQGLVRPHNQDRAGTSSRRTAGEVDSWKELADAGFFWASVADGMGGHAAGNIASDVAIDAMFQSLPAARTEADMANAAIHANRMIYQAMFSGEGRMRMGSTLVAAVVAGDRAMVVNVGDSRAYKLSGGELALLSRDDTLPTGKAGQRQHMLTQSLGGLAYQTSIAPHVLRFAFDRTDQLLLCSDGLTDMVGESEIAKILLENRDDPADALVAAALGEGGRDNISAIVVGPAFDFAKRSSHDG
jgi:serine/threonine protein phosphatase PrpC